MYTKIANRSPHKERVYTFRKARIGGVFEKKLLSCVSASLLVRSLPFLWHILDEIKMYLIKSRLYFSVILNHYHIRNLKTVQHHLLYILIKCVLCHLKSYSETRKNTLHNGESVQKQQVCFIHLHIIHSI